MSPCGTLQYKISQGGEKTACWDSVVQQKAKPLIVWLNKSLYWHQCGKIKDKNGFYVREFKYKICLCSVKQKSTY